VELLLHGRSLGSRPVPRDGHVAWKVAFAPGRLEARGYRGGAVALTATRETTGPAARLVLAADRETIAADGQDVAVVTVRVVDADGRVVPVADDRAMFRVTGPGRIIGVGNGDPSSHEADKGTVRRAFNGLCMAIVQSTKEPGEVQVEAAAPGLAPGVASVRSVPATPRPAVP
jgi:beta-galactosidase